MVGDISPLGQSDNGPSADKLRASHEDRDQVIEILRVAAGDGRLTADELDQRIEVAFSARTYGELAVLTADLPAGMPASAMTAAPAAAAPKDVVRIECRSGNTRRQGRWVVPRRIEVRVASGRVTLDLTEAVIAYPALQIDAEVRSGNLVIVTRPGITVDADDVAVRSGNVRIKAPWGTGVPVTLAVSVSGQVRSGNITAGPRRLPRRSFWQWLRRMPRPRQITSS